MEQRIKYTGTYQERQLRELPKSPNKFKEFLSGKNAVSTTRAIRIEHNIEKARKHLKKWVSFQAILAYYDKSFSFDTADLSNHPEVWSAEQVIETYGTLTQELKTWSIPDQVGNHPAVVMKLREMKLIFAADEDQPALAADILTKDGWKCVASDNVNKTSRWTISLAPGYSLLIEGSDFTILKNGNIEVKKQSLSHLVDVLSECKRMGTIPGPLTNPSKSI